MSNEIKNKNIIKSLKDKNIHYQVKFNIGKSIFKFRKDDEFIKNIIEIINDEKTSAWAKGGLIYAISSLNKSEHIDMVLDFIFNNKENLLVRLEISMEVFKYLLEFEESNERVISKIIEVIKDTTIDSRLRFSFSQALSHVKYINNETIEKLVNFIEDENLEKYIKFSIAYSMIKLQMQNKRFLANLKALIKSRDTKFLDARNLYDFLLSSEKVDKEYQKVIDTIRGKKPKYIKINNFIMKTSVYKEQISKGVMF